MTSSKNAKAVAEAGAPQHMKPGGPVGSANFATTAPFVPNAGAPNG